MFTKHTKTTIVLFGQVTVDINGMSETYDLSEQSQFRDWLESRFDFSRTPASEEINLELMKKGRYADLGGGNNNDDFEYPSSLVALTSEQVSLSRAKGKVTPGSIDVIMALSYGKDNVAKMKDQLEKVAGFQLVNKKPIAVTDGDGMPTGVKFIVSPIVK